MATTPEQAYAIGESIGINWDEVVFSSDALALGIDIEYEHGSALGDGTNITDDDPEATAKIAWAHLLESPDYYVMLATMEDELMSEASEDPRSRKSYMETRSPGTKKEKPQLSSTAKAYLQKYLQQIAQADDSGTSADDAFKQRPDLDDLGPAELLDLLLENPHVGKRQIGKLGQTVQYGDIYDAVQMALQLAIWESAVLWWGEQETQKQQQDETGTVVETPSKAASVGRLYRYYGHRYRELS